MEIQIFIDKKEKERVLVYAHERNELVNSIERLVNEPKDSFVGYKDREIVPLNRADVYCFIVDDNKIYAVTKTDKLQLKCRLYELENSLSSDFIKINKSCIANLKKIEKFSAAFSGALQVNFKNGYVDYVSRRNLKNVKERLGI